MRYDKEIHHRRSIRLKDYDYSQAGAYFVTICTKDRECLFGNIVDREMRLNEYGIVVQKFWNAILNHFQNIELDEFIIMPNHVHGIVAILNNDCRGEVSSPSLKLNNPILKGGETPPLQKRTLGQIVAYFKYQSAKQITISRNNIGTPVWQRNYYEHIIRNENELNSIREYIRYNPLKWDEDEENPNNEKT